MTLFVNKIIGEYQCGFSRNRSIVDHIFRIRQILEKKLEYRFWTMIFPVVLYGCETWSLRLGEEYWLRVFENRIMRQMFGPKGDENGEWRRLHNEELHSLYRSANIVRLIKSRRLRRKDHILWKNFIFWLLLLFWLRSIIDLESINVNGGRWTKRNETFREA